MSQKLNKDEIAKLSNGELAEYLESLIKKADEQPEELDFLRKTLIVSIKDPKLVDAYKLKLLYAHTFNLPMETLEMQQLHLIEVDFLKRLDDIKKIIEKNKEEQRRFNRWFSAGLMAVVGGIATGIDVSTLLNVVREVLRIVFGS